jgi:hypothetical protein
MNEHQPVLTAVPDDALQQLGVLVGTWTVAGPEIQGQTSFEWLEGGFFLLQWVDFVHRGHHVKGREVIGRERKFGAEAAASVISSRFYDNEGNTFDYVYELTADTLTIWGGFVGSPAAFRGRFSSDRTTLNGAWQWPGGGYESTMTRVRPPRQ